MCPYIGCIHNYSKSFLSRNLTFIYYHTNGPKLTLFVIMCCWQQSTLVLFEMLTGALLFWRDFQIGTKVKPAAELGNMASVRVTYCHQPPGQDESFHWLRRRHGARMEDRSLQLCFVIVALLFLQLITPQMEEAHYRSLANYSGLKRLQSLLAAVSKVPQS